METSILITNINNLNFIEPSRGWLYSYCKQVELKNRLLLPAKNLNPDYKGLPEMFKYLSN